MTLPPSISRCATCARTWSLPFPLQDWPCPACAGSVSASKGDLALNKLASHYQRETLQNLAADQDPGGPTCDGPVVVHLDGEYECHGWCRYQTLMDTSYHDPGALTSCLESPETWHECQRA
jgi:hypothetical protein